MANKHLNLSIDTNVYYETKRLVPPGQISRLFSDFLKEYVKKKKREELIAGYKSAAKSRVVKEEDKI
jgi:predicted CopG family antitoxin